MGTWLRHGVRYGAVFEGKRGVSRANTQVRERPSDPFSFIADQFREAAVAGTEPIKPGKASPDKALPRSRRTILI